MDVRVGSIKNAEGQRIDAFELWCWRRLLRVPWTARRYNQSILKEVSPEYSLEGLMLRLKLQYFGHLMWRTDSLEKTLMLGKTEGRRRKEWRDEMVGWHHRLHGHQSGQAPWIGDGRGSLACCRLGVANELDTTEQLNLTDTDSPPKHDSTLWADVHWSLVFYPLYMSSGVELTWVKVTALSFPRLGDLGYHLILGSLFLHSVK